MKAFEKVREVEKSKLNNVKKLQQKVGIKKCKVIDSVIKKKT